MFRTRMRPNTLLDFIWFCGTRLCSLSNVGYRSVVVDRFGRFVDTNCQHGLAINKRELELERQRGSDLAGSPLYSPISMIVFNSNDSSASAQGGRSAGLGEFIMRSRIYWRQQSRGSNDFGTAWLLKKRAERGRFELPVPCGTPVFKTGAIGHSATSPDTAFAV